MAIYISNAFSLQMLGGLPSSIHVTSLSADEVATEINGDEWTSAVGHHDTAAIITSMLAIPVSMNRVSVTLHKGDRLYVAQVTGGRLPEGCTELPPGIRIEWRRVLIEEEAGI